MSKVQEVLEEWHGIEFYESADVGKTRQSKWCNICDNDIPSGSSHLGFRFYGEGSSWPVFVVCNDCEETHADDLHLIREHKED